jgi:hypothetical protein
MLTISRIYRRFFDMKRFLGLLAMATLGLALYAPAAHAQWNNLPNQYAWQNFMANHPKAAAQLHENPTLIYNSNWRQNHPGFDEWIQKHPSDWAAMRRPAPWQDRYGAWDRDEWRDQDWWYHHNPSWSHSHHPEWWQEHKDWLTEREERREDRLEDERENQEEWREQQAERGYEHSHGHGHAWGHDKDHGHGHHGDND